MLSSLLILATTIVIIYLLLLIHIVRSSMKLTRDVFLFIVVSVISILLWLSTAYSIDSLPFIFTSGINSLHLFINQGMFMNDTIIRISWMLLLLLLGISIFLTQKKYSIEKSLIISFFIILITLITWLNSFIWIISSYM